MTKNYRSCFVVDVKVGEGRITLTDSQRISYFIDADDMDKEQFKAWLQTFLEGVSQRLTVFEYVDKGGPGEFEYHVTKFYGVSRPTMVNG